MTIAVRLVVLLLPAALLLLASFRVEPQAQQILWIGAGIQGAIFLFYFLSGRIGRPLHSTGVAIVYVLALLCVWMSRGIAADWYSPLAQFLLLAIPLIVFALQTLDDSGAIASRRANLLADRLARRKEWPAHLADCRTLPEVKALREALAIDAGPALALLKDSRPQVRLAALAALEFRQQWKPGQPHLVLRFAQQTREPLLRAAALTALANLDDRPLVESLAEFLRDPSREVRQAAVEALLWDCETRWGWIRTALHQTLADPALAGDGPLLPESGTLSTDAQNDLTAWANEKGIIGTRAAQTLGAHHQRILSNGIDPKVVRPLKDQLGNPQTPPPLRMEVAQVLRSVGELDKSLQEQLLDPGTPAPLRLLVAEELLAGSLHPQAIAALRELARTPNREMALNTADVVQRRLGIDLGLAIGQPLPPLHSRQTTDVIRRLMKWAARQDLHSDSGDDPDDIPGGDHGSGTFDMRPGSR